MIQQTWFFVVLAGLFVLANGISWYRTWRLFGRVPWRLMAQMLNFTWHTTKAVLLGLYAAALVSCLVVYVATIPANSILAGMFLIALSPFLIETKPPAVIFLTCSSPQSAEIFRVIRRAIAPLRCVALLDYRRLGALQLFECFHDNLRTSNGKVWKSIVHQLIEIAPMVVVDTRSEIKTVAGEAFMMLALERAGRAIFLVGLKGECSALLAHGIDPIKYALRIATEETLAMEIRNLLNERQALRNHDLTSLEGIKYDIFI